MAYMDGKLLRAGFADNTSAWNAADSNGTTLGAGDGIAMAVDSGVPEPSVQMEEINVWTGSGFRYASLKTGEGINGTIRCYAGWLLQSRLWAQLLGTEATSNDTPAVGEDSHLLTWNTDTEDLYGSLAFYDGLLVRDIEACKVIGVTVTHEKGKPSMEDWQFLGRKELHDDTGANTVASMANVTLPTLVAGAEWMFLNKPSSFSFRINAASGGALGSGDVLTPDKITIRCVRPGILERLNTGTGYYIEEGIGGDLWDVGIAVEFDSVTANTIRGWWKNGTELKADLTIDSGVTIASSGTYKRTHEWPSLTPVSFSNPIDGPNLLRESFGLIAHKALSAPTGMTRTEHSVTITDSVATDHLAG